MNSIGGILPVLASLTGPGTCRTADVSVGGRGLGPSPHLLEGSHLHKLSQRLVTTPGEVARQIMQHIYKKATFPPATGPLCARRSENFHVRVDKTVPAQAQSARFDVATTPDELVAATRQAIADVTAFDARDINRNFDYDYEAYGEVKRNLSRLVASGQLRLAMQLALDLMKRGSHQVGMSDEGLMAEDIEDCLCVVIEAVTKSDFPAEEVLAWCSAMLNTDRMGIIALRPLEALGHHVRAITRRTFHQRPTGPASPGQRSVSTPGRAVRLPNIHWPPAQPGMRRTVFTRLPKGHGQAAPSSYTYGFADPAAALSRTRSGRRSPPLRSARPNVPFGSSTTKPDVAIRKSRAVEVVDGERSTWRRHAVNELVASLPESRRFLKP